MSKPKAEKKNKKAKGTSAAVWTIKEKLLAKTLYFRGMKVEIIHEMTNIPYLTLRSWIYGTPTSADERFPTESWKVEREAYYAEVWKNVTEADAEELASIIGLTTKYIKKNLLAYMVENEGTATPKDLKLLSDIVANYDRILRLTRGQPTERILHKLEAQSMEELLEQTRLALENFKETDPMAVGASYTVLEDGSVQDRDSSTPDLSQG